LLADFEADVPRLLDGLNEDRWAASLKLAGWPQKVRGFGHVRAASAVQAGLERAAQWQLLG
jgi:indolepyruvate ferredoxin oxidoreductase